MPTQEQLIDELLNKCYKQVQEKIASHQAGEYHALLVSNLNNSTDGLVINFMLASSSTTLYVLLNFYMWHKHSILTHSH